MKNVRRKRIFYKLVDRWPFDSEYRIVKHIGKPHKRIGTKYTLNALYIYGVIKQLNNE